MLYEYVDKISSAECRGLSPVISVQFTAEISVTAYKRFLNLKLL